MPLALTFKGWRFGASVVRVSRGDQYAPGAHSPGLETFHDGSGWLVIPFGRFGLCLWRHNARPVTVGERGAW